MSTIKGLSSLEAFLRRPSPLHAPRCLRPQAGFGGRLLRGTVVLSMVPALVGWASSPSDCQNFVIGETKLGSPINLIPTQCAYLYIHVCRWVLRSNFGTVYERGPWLQERRLEEVSFKRAVTFSPTSDAILTISALNLHGTALPYFIRYCFNSWRRGSFSTNKYLGRARKRAGGCGASR